MQQFESGKALRLLELNCVANFITLLTVGLRKLCIRVDLPQPESPGVKKIDQECCIKDTRLHEIYSTEELIALELLHLPTKRVVVSPSSLLSLGSFSTKLHKSSPVDLFFPDDITELGSHRNPLIELSDYCKPWVTNTSIYILTQ